MKFSPTLSVWPTVLSRSKGCPTFSSVFLGISLVISPTALLVGERFGYADEHYPGCGCEISAANCEVGCGVGCGEGGCDAPSCGCSSPSRTRCNMRKSGLPGLGEGLLDGLDKMTDRFENGVSKLLGSGCKSKSHGCCGSLAACDCTNAYAGELENFSEHSSTAANPPASYEALSPETDLNASASPKNVEHIPTAPVQTMPPERIPSVSPVPEPTEKKPERQGNPFIDEARSRRKEQPEVHVAKVQSSVRGSTRRRYTTPMTPKIMEAVDPSSLTAPEVVTAGAMQTTRKQKAEFAR